MEYIITTSSRADNIIINKAREFSNKLSIPFITRDNKSLQNIIDLYPNKAIFLVEKERNILIFNNYEYFFHPGMAKIRIRALKNGQNDQMIEAMNLSSCDSVLDCTLGLASDAIVASYFLGINGKVVGTESVNVLAAIVSDGLNNYRTSEKDLKDAMKRIKVLNIDHKEFLRHTPSNSFDIIYFDPMFQNTLMKSSSIQALKPFGNNQAIDEETIILAKEVARKRIVIKERSFSKEFQRLGCNQIVGGKYSKIAYGVIDID